MRDHRAAYTLARQLCATYALLVVYASLHPFAGWRDAGLPLFDFLRAPWPRYYTGFDLAVNIVAYVPLGFLLVPALRARCKPGRAVLLAILLAIGLSLGMETLQNYLPSRVASNVDLGCNGLGALLGALGGARWGRIFADGGWLSRWRRRRVVRGSLGDAGLVLMTAWLLTQASPEALFLGNGDLRSFLDLPSPLSYSAESFLTIEMIIAGCGVVSAGLITWHTLREKTLWLLLALLVGVVLVRALAAALQTGGGGLVHWVTPGNLSGFAAGTLALLVATRLPLWLQSITAAVALLAATVLVNVGPENPYIVEALNAWHAGHFLNFNGLTRVLSLLWPFAALAYLMALSASRPERPR